MSLIGHWKFDGDALASVGGVDGTPVNSPTYAAGRSGQALSLNGSSQYVHFGDNFGIAAANAQTWMAWLKMTSATPSTLQRIWQKQSSTPPYPGFSTQIRGDAAGDPIEFRIYGSPLNSRIVVIPAVSHTTNWRHLAITYDGSGVAAGVVCYLDGEVLTPTVSDDALAGSITNSTNFCVGSNLGTTQFFDGLIDDFRIYDTVLSAAEVNNAMRFALPVKQHHYRRMRGAV